MISGLFWDVIVMRGRFILGPIGFGHQVPVAANGYPFQFFHDVFLPVSSERPRIHRYDCQACFGVLSFFCLDSLIIILSPDQAKVLDIGAELREVIIGIPDAELFVC